MSTFASTVDDLNLDFSDRNWEIAPQDGRRLQFEFKLHDTDSECSEVESEVDECDMDDEYFFDHRLDFGHYAPEVLITQASDDLTTDEPKSVLSDPTVLNDNETCDKAENLAKNTGSEINTTIDENRNERKVIANGDTKTVCVNGLNLDTLTTAVEKFSLAVSLVCIEVS